METEYARYFVSAGSQFPRVSKIKLFPLRLPVRVLRTLKLSIVKKISSIFFPILWTNTLCNDVHSGEDCNELESEFTRLEWDVPFIAQCRRATLSSIGPV